MEFKEFCSRNYYMSFLNCEKEPFPVKKTDCQEELSRRIYRILYHQKEKLTLLSNKPRR